jgi:hypothetical protein
MYVHQLRDNVEAYPRATDLIVEGVPILGKENYTILYQKIAVAIGYSQYCIPQADTFRLGVIKSIAFQVCKQIREGYLSPKILWCQKSKFEPHRGWNVDQRNIYHEESHKISAANLFGLNGTSTWEKGAQGISRHKGI